MVVGHGKRGIKTQRLSVALKLTHYRLRPYPAAHHKTKLLW
jgi:hypothetical protein